MFLPGGPGIPATVIGRVPVYYAWFEQLRAIAEVVLPDQRGIGMSSPNTQCPEGPPPPSGIFAREQNFREFLVERARLCADDWRAKGVDVAAFTTAASAGDIDDLRRALGADKLTLIAHCYGTFISAVLFLIPTANCKRSSTGWTAGRSR